MFCLARSSLYLPCIPLASPKRPIISRLQVYSATVKVDDVFRERTIKRDLHTGLNRLIGRTQTMTTAQMETTTRRKLIVDVDPGVDDAQALVMALSREDVEVLAVTCVHGNVAVDQSCRNALRTLELCQRLDVPVYGGCDGPLVPSQRHRSVYGKDGLGDKPDLHPKVREDLSQVQQEHSSVAICRLAKEHKGQITLVALGPVTNVAVALKLDPKLGESLKETLVMGGNMHGEGNTTPAAEFNFGSDPEAAQICVSSLSITLVTWECCRDQVILPWEWYDRVAKLNTPKAKFIAEINADMAARRRQKSPHYFSCDPAAMAMVLDPSAIAESKKYFCEVELHGSVTRGQMVVDWMGRSSNPPNVTLVTKTNPAAIMELYEQMLK